MKGNPISANSTR